jgi:hypothetical protein
MRHQPYDHWFVTAVGCQPLGMRLRLYEHLMIATPLCDVSLRACVTSRMIICLLLLCDVSRRHASLAVRTKFHCYFCVMSAVGMRHRRSALCLFISPCDVSPWHASPAVRTRLFISPWDVSLWHASPAVRTVEHVCVMSALGHASPAVRH